MKEENRSKNCAIQLKGHVFAVAVELFDEIGLFNVISAKNINQVTMVIKTFCY